MQLTNEKPLLPFHNIFNMTEIQQVQHQEQKNDGE